MRIDYEEVLKNKYFNVIPRFMYDVARHLKELPMDKALIAAKDDYFMWGELGNEKQYMYNEPISRIDVLRITNDSEWFFKQLTRAEIATIVSVKTAVECFLRVCTDMAYDIGLVEAIKNGKTGSAILYHASYQAKDTMLKITRKILYGEEFNRPYSDAYFNEYEQFVEASNKFCEGKPYLGLHFHCFTKYNIHPAGYILLDKKEWEKRKGDVEYEKEIILRKFNDCKSNDTLRWYDDNGKKEYGLLNLLDGHFNTKEFSEMTTDTEEEFKQLLDKYVVEFPEF